MILFRIFRFPARRPDLSEFRTKTRLTMRMKLQFVPGSLKIFPSPGEFGAEGFRYRSSALPGAIGTA
jgi:hypothetical protein